MSTTRAQTQALPEMICHRCGVVDSPVVERGPFGPHAAKAMCRHCGGFIQWLSSRTPAERQEARQRALEAWMATQPATEKQLRFLKVLGYGGEPANKYEASKTIGALLRKEQHNDNSLTGKPLV